MTGPVAWGFWSAMAQDRINHGSAHGLSAERFQALADLLPVIVWRVSADLGEDWMNRAWSAFTGMGRGDDGPANWLDLVHPSDRRRVSAGFDSAFRAREPIDLSYRLRRRDGEFRWMSENGVPVYRGSYFDGFVGVCLDVHQQRRNADLIEGFRLSLGEILLPDREIR